MRNVLPAKAGTHLKIFPKAASVRWIPAFAGMTCMVMLTTSLHAAELKMDRAVCDYVTKHVPSASVTYQPGVDAEGKAVAPADLNPSPLNKELEKQIAIKLTNQTAKVFGLQSAFPEVAIGNTTQPLVEGETQIGFVTLRDGQPWLNGQPLSSAQQDELAVLCIERKKR